MGPTGQGPRTGRGAGYCGGNAAPGSATAGRRGLGGGGRGRGRGGRGRRNLFYATGLTGWQRTEAGKQAFGEPVAPDPTPSVPTNSTEQSDVAMLKDQAADLARSLEDIQRRLDGLEGNTQEGQTTEAAAE